MEKDTVDSANLLMGSSWRGTLKRGGTTLWRSRLVFTTAFCSSVRSEMLRKWASHVVVPTYKDKSQTDILPSTICVKKSRRATKNRIANPVLLIWMIMLMIMMTIIPLHFGSTEADVQQNTESCRVSPSIQVELIIKMTVVFIEDK